MVFGKATNTRHELVNFKTTFSRQHLRIYQIAWLVMPDHYCSRTLLQKEEIVGKKLHRNICIYKKLLLCSDSNSIFPLRSIHFGLF